MVNPMDRNNNISFNTSLMSVITTVPIVTVFIDNVWNKGSNLPDNII